MQRKPGFPHHASCNLKIDDDPEQRQLLLLVNFGHAQWGFKNWSWLVSKQQLDFTDFMAGEYTAGVVAFVSVTVKSLDIHRENIGYATTSAPMKGSAVHQARKESVTNALRETLLSFGGSVATDLLELLETQKLTENAPAIRPAPSTAMSAIQHEPNHNNNQNTVKVGLTEPKNVSKIGVVHPPRKDSVDSAVNVNTRPPQPQQPNPVPKTSVVQTPPPPVAKALPMPANRPPANKHPANQQRPPPPQQPRPNSNDAGPEGADEEARAERRRRQRQAQEQFRQKQMVKQKNDTEPDSCRLEHRSSFDSLLLQLPSQDIVIEETGGPAPAPAEAKRKSPQPAGGGLAKRRSVVASKLDILTD